MPGLEGRGVVSGAEVFSATGDLGHDGAQVAAGLLHALPVGELRHGGPARAARFADVVTPAVRGAHGSDAEVLRIRVLVELFVGRVAAALFVSHRPAPLICLGRRESSRAFIT